MSSPSPDDPQFLIRCPSCGQRFKVMENLLGRTVECGGCEHRFRIADDVIVRGKKFYPGEKRDNRLYRFHRVPMAMAPSLAGAEPVQYGEPPDPSIYEPASPQRIIAGFIGVCLMVFMALLLMFGARSGGMLDGMLTQNRMLMAGFTGVLGSVLLIYANPRARIKALMVGFLFCVGLVSLPLVFTAGSSPLVSTPVPPVEEDLFRDLVENDDQDDAGAETLEIAELRSLIGTDPLVAEIRRLEAIGSTRTAVGLWLRDLREQNRFLIRDYILRTTGADPETHYYPRGSGDFLMVVTGINMSIDELARIAGPLGNVERIHREISVIEVMVNNENFIEGPVEKLSDRGDPSFYDLNKRELESIDMGRVERAVKRLAEAEPKVYRSDISRQLLTLLVMDGVDFKADICRALMTWSPEPGPAGEAALRVASQLHSHGVSVPPEMISLVLAEKTPGLSPLLHQLWEDNPNQWESHYAGLGPAAESALLRRLPTTEGAMRQSAVRLLGRVGGAAALPALQAELPGANAEMRVLIENATRSIRSRLED